MKQRETYCGIEVELDLLGGWEISTSVRGAVVDLSGSERSKHELVEAESCSTWYFC